MPRRPNYGQQRAERDRAARSKTSAKLSALQERAERRKSERDGQEPEAAGDPANEATNPDRDGNQT